MKTKRIIGIFWLIFGVLYLISGFGLIYKYSQPNVLWFVMIPIIIAYSKIIGGILCLLIGIKFSKTESQKDYSILYLIIPLIIYSLYGMLRFGVFTIYYSGENLLLLILIGISIYKLKSIVEINLLAENLKENRKELFRILLLTFLPYLLNKITYYELFSFLH